MRAGEIARAKKSSRRRVCVWARTRVGGSKGRVRARMIARRGPGVKKKVRDRSPPSPPSRPLHSRIRGHTYARSRNSFFFSPVTYNEEGARRGGGWVGWEETCIRCRTRGRRAGPAFSVDFSSFFTGDGSLLSLSLSFSFFPALARSRPRLSEHGEEHQ